MAPMHHHFELKGWAEPKIIVRFWIISIMLAARGAHVAEAEVATWAPRTSEESASPSSASRRAASPRRGCCAREGAHVTVTDRRGEELLAGPLAALQGAGVRRALGGHDPADFTGADLVVVSPGVPMAIPEIVAARSAARSF